MEVRDPFTSPLGRVFAASRGKEERVVERMLTPQEKFLGWSVFAK